MKPFLFCVLICIKNILYAQEFNSDSDSNYYVYYKYTDSDVVRFLERQSYTDFNEYYDLIQGYDYEKNDLYWYYKGRVDLYNDCFHVAND